LLHKNVITILCFLSLYQSAKAQKGDFLFSADLGYGFASGDQSILYYSSSNSTSILPFSLGKGVNISTTGVYMPNNYIGGGLDLNMLIGTPNTYTEPVGNSKGDQEIAIVGYTGYLFSITPTLQFILHDIKFTPYAQFGPAIGFAEYTLSNRYTGNSAIKGEGEWLYNGNDPTIGFYSAVGIRIPLGRKKMLDIEVFDRDITYIPNTESNIEDYGAKISPNTTALVTTMTNNSPTSNAMLTSVMPFGSIGIKIGITWDCGAVKLDR